MDQSLKRDREQGDALAASEGKPFPTSQQKDGVGTPEGGTDTGVSGVTRTSAGPGETGGYGADVRPSGVTGDDGGTREEQEDEGEA